MWDVLPFCVWKQWHGFHTLFVFQVLLDAARLVMNCIPMQDGVIQHWPPGLPKRQEVWAVQGVVWGLLHQRPSLHHGDHLLCHQVLVQGKHALPAMPLPLYVPLPTVQDVQLCLIRVLCIYERST